MAFADSFLALVGVPWWLPLLGLAVLGVAYRLYRALTGERREAARRRRIIDDLKQFIGGATRANRQRAQELYAEKMRQHAQAYVYSQSIRKLLDVSGIGQASLRALEAAGYRSLGDAATRSIGSVHGLGPVKADAAGRFIRTWLEQSASDLMKDPDSLPRDPTIEARYSAAIEQLQIRNEVLAADDGGLQPVVEDIHEYEVSVAARDTGAHLREWLQSPWNALRTEPTRMLRFLLVALLFLAVSVAVPVVALGVGNAGMLAATYAGYGAVVLLFLVYVFISDRGVRLGTRAPDPSSFQEQRLQFFALKLALQRRLAPPEVRLTSASAAVTTGHRAGPSLIHFHLL